MGYLAGGLVGTVEDTVYFVQMLLNDGKMANGKRLLKKSTLSMMKKNRLNPKTCGEDKVCYLGNMNLYRPNGHEVGMGGAACTYWNIDEEDKTGTVWFTQHVDMPEFEDLKGVDPNKADMWKALHLAVMQGKRKQLGTASQTTIQVKRAKMS